MIIIIEYFKNMVKLGMGIFVREICCLVGYCLLLYSCIGMNHEQQTTGQYFYLDAVSGNDDNTGLSPEQD